MRALFALVFCVQAYLVVGQCSTSNPCSSDQTCCPGPTSGEFGCCTAADAVCCSDGLHCCPSGTVCDLSDGTCDSSSNIPLVFLKKEQPDMKLKSVSMKKAQNVERVYCPDGQHYCNDGNTCCLLYTGQYGCCPFPKAMCCNDRYHCCPNGTRCDATSQHCLRADSPVIVARKQRRTPAFPVL